MKNIKILSLILFLFMATAALNAATPSPETVVSKAASVIGNAKGITANFRMTSGKHTTSGTIKSAGKKFSVILPEVSTWYNGKNLYTYNPRTNETTLTVPTATELLESNPLLYVKGGAGAYTYSFSKNPKKGKYVVDLTPRKKNTGIRKLVFTIDAKSYTVERIEVTADGGASVIDVTSFKTDVVPPASEFEYPSRKYPKAEIVDLR